MMVFPLVILLAAHIGRIGAAPVIVTGKEEGDKTSTSVQAGAGTVATQMSSDNVHVHASGATGALGGKLKNFDTQFRFHSGHEDKNVEFDVNATPNKLTASIMNAHHAKATVKAANKENEVELRNDQCQTFMTNMNQIQFHQNGQDTSVLAHGAYSMIGVSTNCHQDCKPVEVYGQTEDSSFKMTIGGQAFKLECTENKESLVPQEMKAETEQKEEKEDKKGMGAFCGNLAHLFCGKIKEAQPDKPRSKSPPKH